MRTLKAVVLILAALPLSSAIALDTLPYSARIHPYSGWNATVQGDIRTLGMSGATIGLADTFTATLDNPAGLAMTLNGVDVNFASNTVYDGNIQNFSFAVHTYDFGVALTHYPWAFSIGYVSNTSEGQPYLLSTVPNDPTSLLITTNEIRLSAARILFENRFSLGAGLIVGQSQELLDFSTATDLSRAYRGYAISAVAGALLRLGGRFFVGVGYRMPMQYAGNTVDNPTTGLPNFIQPIIVPSRLGLGVGWIPNRLFRADFSLFIIGGIDNVTLLRDDTTPIGRSTTIQPRLGLAYDFIDFKELRSTLYAGLYFEWSRIENAPSRLHTTAGLDVKPWIFNLGLGIDSANQYQSFILSVGIDLVKILEKSEIIPPLPRSPPAGAFPKPTYYSTEGLPGTLVVSGKPKDIGMDPITIGLQIPKKVQEKAKQFSKKVQKLGRDVVKAIEKEGKRKNSKKKVKPNKPITVYDDM